MRRYVYLVIFFIFNIFFIQSESFSDEIAVTQDGRQVLLMDNKTWKYLIDEKERPNIIKVNLDVKRALKPFIVRRDKALSKVFILEIDWDDNPFDIMYRSVMEDRKSVV